MITKIEVESEIFKTSVNSVIFDYTGLVNIWDYSV